jgi:hypothetical protein
LFDKGGPAKIPENIALLSALPRAVWGGAKRS